MKTNQTINRIWQEESGVLAFEWILLGTLLVIGIIGGLAFYRDAAIFQFGNIAQAAGSLDQTCGYDGCPYFTETADETTEAADANGGFEDTRASSKGAIISISQDPLED